MFYNFNLNWTWIYQNVLKFKQAERILSIFVDVLLKKLICKQREEEEDYLFYSLTDLGTGDANTAGVFGLKGAAMVHSL